MGDLTVTGVQTCALPISERGRPHAGGRLERRHPARGLPEAAGARERPILRRQVDDPDPLRRGGGRGRSRDGSSLGAAPRAGTRGLRRSGGRSLLPSRQRACSRGGRIVSRELTLDRGDVVLGHVLPHHALRGEVPAGHPQRMLHLVHPPEDRKSTRLNSSHSQISHAVFCLTKKKTPPLPNERTSSPEDPPPYNVDLVLSTPALTEVVSHGPLTFPAANRRASTTVRLHSGTI